MSKQLKTLEKLLLVIFSNKNFLQREDLRVEFCKENKEFDEYFNKAYEILEESNFILERKSNLNVLGKTSQGPVYQDELNHEFCDIYKITKPLKIILFREESDAELFKSSLDEDGINDDFIESSIFDRLSENVAESEKAFSLEEFEVPLQENLFNQSEINNAEDRKKKC